MAWGIPPWRVTITELIMSGTEVPMARMVSPMTDCGMPMLSPKMMAIHTMKKASERDGMDTEEGRARGAEARGM